MSLLHLSRITRNGHESWLLNPSDIRDVRPHELGSVVRLLSEPPEKFHLVKDDIDSVSAVVTDLWERR